MIKPSTGHALAHVHLDYVERFRIEAGRAKAKLNGRSLELGPGDEVEVPLGHRHVNPYNPGDEDLVERQIFEPTSDFALAYFETLGYFMREARTDRRGELPVLAAFAVAHVTRSRTYVVGPPPALQRGVLFPLGARLARLRGYEVHPPFDLQTANMLRRESERAQDVAGDVPSDEVEASRVATTSLPQIAQRRSGERSLR